MAGRAEQRLVEAFVDAVNRHDVSAIVAMVSDDVEVSFAGLTPFEGKDRVRAYFEWFAGYGASWDLTIVAIDDGLVRCRLAAHDRWSEAAGISPLRYSRVDITVDNGVIRRIDTEFSPASNHALSTLLEEFTPWATARYPELYTEEGDYAYYLDSAARMVTAMIEFQEERSS